MRFVKHYLQNRIALTLAWSKCSNLGSEQGSLISPAFELLQGRRVQEREGCSTEYGNAYVRICR